MNRELVKGIQQGQVLLFVGAGVSMNLGLPSWGGLMAILAEELDFDPEVFVAHAPNDQLAEYYKLKKQIGPLRGQLDLAWHGNVQIGNSRVHQLIVELGFPVIYTTNFDRLLEKAFAHYGKPFTKITVPSDLVGAKGTLIVKFHGDFDHDQTLVLSESDFFRRLNFEEPLDIGLRSDLINKSVLFVGYSLSDVNVRYMLFRLWEILTKHGSSNRPKAFVWLGKPNVVQEEVLASRGIVPLTSEEDASGKALLDFLESLAAAVKNPVP